MHGLWLVQLVLALSFVALAAGGTALVLASQINDATCRRGAEPRCPSCGVRDARASGQRAFRDPLFGWFSCAPFRCRQCGSRFYWYVKRTLKNAV